MLDVTVCKTTLDNFCVSINVPQTAMMWSNLQCEAACYAIGFGANPETDATVKLLGCGTAAGQHEWGHCLAGQSCCAQYKNPRKPYHSLHCKQPAPVRILLRATMAGSSTSNPYGLWCAT